MAGASITDRPQRGGALDALRFVAAAFVVLYHYGSEAPAPLDQVAPVLGRGWLATDFFLLLSGYVLGRAYGAELDAGGRGAAGFVGRRLRRVWPAHLLVLLGFAALVGGGALFHVGPLHPGRFGAEGFWLQAALIHAWGTTVQPAWNVPSWTLSALVVCYLAFPAVWRAARSLKGRTLAGAGALVVLALGAALSLVALDRSLFDLPFQYGVLRALPLFIAGALLARFRQDREIGAGTAITLALVGAVGLALFAPAPRSALADFAAVIAIAVLVVAADARPRRGSSIAASAAALSFALFITHALAGAVWFGAVRVLVAGAQLGRAAAWGLWAGGLPFALAVAWAFHRWIDAPLQARLAAFRLRPVPRPAPAPSG